MLQSLLRSPRFLRAVAWFVHAIDLRVVQFRKVVIVFSWKLVDEVLRRDNDFRVKEVTGERMNAVAGPFFLGLDRCPQSFAQRDVGNRAIGLATCQALAAAIEESATKQLEGGPHVVDVVNGFFRPVSAATAIRVFGIAGPGPAELMDTTRAVFHHTFLNLKSLDKDVERAGVAAGQRLRRWILDEIAARRASGATPDDFLNTLMRLGHDKTDEEIATILAGYVVGSIDTTTTALTYVTAELLKDRPLLDAVKKDMRNDARLFGWCMEILRRRPQAPILIRKTDVPVDLGGRAIPGNSYVVAATSTAHFDPDAFPKPDRMDPERPRDNYLHFGNGPHVCAGRGINAIQFPILLRHVLGKDPYRADKIGFAGPFPDRLNVTFRSGS